MAGKSGYPSASGAGTGRPGPRAPFAALRLEPAALVRIDIDDHGIPHVEAQSVEDAFFGQGYAAAFMRLWQLDVQYRRLAGRLAEAFGAPFVDFDRAARLMLSRVDPCQDWEALGPRLRAIGESFVAGINRRVQEVHEDPALVPPEFGLFDLLPATWAVDDLVRIRHCGSPNVRAEFRRALLHGQGALDLDALVQELAPAHALRVPEGLAVEGFEPGQLALYECLSAPLPFTEAWRPAQRAAIDALNDADDADQGSNAWVIAGRWTDTGRPILANDPHLAFSIPGPRMITHLSAPGFNVIGAGPVWRPGVQFGHNEDIAFGRTDFAIDQEDLYVLELDSGGRSYRSPSGWVAIERRRESIAVRGGEAVTVELAHAGMGPIIHEDRKAGRALALRAVWLQPATCVALEYVPKLFARDWTSFRAALRSAVWGTNYLYADRQGNIGWQAAGRVPVRAHHDGLMPVPAASGYEWTGILSLDEMPHEYNPGRGWIASSNQQPRSPNWPANGRTISFEWKPDDRHRRVCALLGGMAKAGSARTGIAEQWRFQQDVLSLRAVELTEALRAFRAGASDLAARASEPAARAIDTLLSWDCRLAADSVPALLYAGWWSALNEAARACLVPSPLQPLIPTLHPHAVTRWVHEQLDAADGAGVEGWYLIEQSLRSAWERVRALQGDGKQPLAWGEVHRVDLRHPLDRWLGERWGEALHAEGGASGGDAATVCARWYAGFDRPCVTGGAGFRAVVDVGQWDRAIAINLPGQSGDPRSPWYRNLYPRWIEGRPVPLHFDHEQVARHSALQMNIEPRTPPGVPDPGESK